MVGSAGISLTSKALSQPTEVIAGSVFVPQNASW